MINPAIAANPTVVFYLQSIESAAKKQLSVGDLFARAKHFADSDQKQMAVELYKTFIAYHPDDPFLYAIYFNYGMALNDGGDRFGAINALRDCLRLNPDFHSAYVNLGRVLEDGGQTGPAVTIWMDLVNRLAAVNGETVAVKLTALQQIGRVLRANVQNAPAEDSLKQSLDINPDQTEIIQHWIAIRQAQCKWPVIAGWDRLPKTALMARIFPWSLANHSDDPMFQFATAFIHNKRAVGVVMRAETERPHFSKARRSAKLRLGYVSSDLRDHAVGFGMTEVFELHDRAAFEVFAYYCGISQDDATKARIRTGVDHWLDINALSDEAAAQRIADDKIDILIDLNGYTMNARTRIFAFRPAPIVVNWFGFPHTMGSPYHHYIIADDFIIPSEAEKFYSENVLRLPCYQPNDRRRAVSDRRPSRAEQNLPDDAFVFCCLNGLQKLTAITFQRWLAILAQVPDSVLWLLGADNETNERLRALAANQGVAPARLVFAERASNPDHLARYPLADLFLDNLPYGAHTTASDALWMGVPILTLPGRGFASRVCASLVRAAGIPEMVCDTPEAYIARAVALATDRAAWSVIKAKLAAARDTCLLFDIPQLMRHLEALYQTMWADFEADTLPVPDLENLSIYHEIGLDLDHETIELLSDEDYEAMYRAKLAVWNETYPIKSDRRLWREPAISI